MSKKEKDTSRFKFVNRFTGEELSTYAWYREKETKKPTKEYSEAELEKHKQKIDSKKKEFTGTCPICKEQLHYLGGNILLCNNTKCRGVEKKVTLEDGTKVSEFTQYHKLVSSSYGCYGEKLFMD